MFEHVGPAYVTSNLLQHVLIYVKAISLFRVNHKVGIGVMNAKEVRCTSTTRAVNNRMLVNALRIFRERYLLWVCILIFSARFR